MNCRDHSATPCHDFNANGDTRLKSTGDGGLSSGWLPEASAAAGQRTSRASTASGEAHRAFVALGANLADPVAQLRAAGAALAHLPESRLLQLSSLYRTAPVGIRGQPDFINAVAELATGLGPEQLLETLLAVERRFGRCREFHHSPRTLDLDLLLYDELVVESPRLSVPHPRMHLRAFVIAPLLEIAPHSRIPGRGDAAAWLPAVSRQRIERLGE